AQIGAAKITDTHGYGTLTLKGVFEKSSNVGFALAVNKYYHDSPKRFVEKLYQMGLNEPLPMQIAGSRAPVIRKPGDRFWDKTTLTNMAYGYALLITPLKTLTFYNAVANDGKMVSPLLVKELRQYGQTLRTYRAQTMVNSIASKKTIAQVREAMEAVVDEGTAKILRNPYYKVGGKTGTAQVSHNGRYADRNGGRHYLATIVGYFPADHPKYSCLVSLKTYNGPGHRRFYYGATLAGPVFKAIADRVYAKNTAWQTPISKRKKRKEETPLLKAGRAEEIREVAYHFEVPYKGRRGEAAWRGIVAVDSATIHYIGYDSWSNDVPSVIGMGLKEALYLLERRGMTVSFSGAGGVESQSVAPGTPVRRGMTIHLALGTDSLPQGIYLPSFQKPDSSAHKTAKGSSDASPDDSATKRAQKAQGEAPASSSKETSHKASDFEYREE
ncbi:MAG: penicillin-binding transpeptidase domain-containing protein, partial [Alistipes sp.]|nr:penicillin-binding transpeptidase domain-containing protein [Alistipes sp.]